MKSSLLYKLFMVSFLIAFFTQNSYSQQATVTINQDPKIPRLLALKKDLDKENKLTDGYTIQLYYGELDKANDVIRKYKNTFSSWPAAIEYETPNYKVWVGNYSTRLEADRALVIIQESFSTAFILKPERRK